MKRLSVILLAALFSTGCALGQYRVTPPEALVGINSAIASSANVAAAAYTQGLIDLKEACTVEQYGRLARRIVDDAWIAWVTGDPKTAQDHILAAREVLSGASAEAAVLVADHCGGNP